MKFYQKKFTSLFHASSFRFLEMTYSSKFHYSLKLVYIFYFIHGYSLIVAQNYNIKIGYDARYFRHGSQENEIDGGTCAEFVQINRMNTCCLERDDECYMIHYDTRCYCDIFCNRDSMNDHSDCCPDAKEVCTDVAKPNKITESIYYFNLISI